MRGNSRVQQARLACRSRLTGEACSDGLRKRRLMLVYKWSTSALKVVGAIDRIYAVPISFSLSRISRTNFHGMVISGAAGYNFLLIFARQISLEFLPPFSIVSLMHIENQLARVHCLDEPL